MKHILHVDRSKVFKKVIHDLCRDEALEYVSASSVEETLEILNDEGADLILCSKELDHESGEELILALNKSPHKDIPVVLITSDEKLETRSRFFELGIVDYILRKDVSDRKLSRYMRTIGSRESARSGFGNLSYAVLDDSKVSRKIISSILSFENATNVKTFDDPMTLLAEPDAMDVYLVDLIIPHMSGEEVVKILRERYPDSIIIAVSSVDNIKTISYVLDAGADDYIIKPFDSGLLLARLRNCIRTQSLVRDLKAKQEELEEQARTDGLTGLYNHRHAMESLEKYKAIALRSEAPLSVLLLDLDFFKKVNDTYGHPVGDDVLRALSALLKEHFVSKELLCRYGGEEFLVILPGADLTEAVAKGNSFLNKVRSYDFPGVDYALTVSCGASCLDHDDPGALIHRADDLLYRSKKEGRDRLSS